ncbi:unnamed protein product [Parnassius apollo]|uniref:(apollo) hypothetical protein n=1 Tax=Parnassius apollo TaxID=110799 RepID=A0A8S3XNW1_PARAO|nr:unnamed protein product [Parnassius apollo]
MTIQKRFKVTLIVVIISIGSSYAHQKCRMPNGYTGECRFLDDCKPLLDVNNKKIKTEEELLYLRESSCGTTSNFRYKICCPLESEWSKALDLKPVLFPEIIKYMSEPGDNRSDNNLHLASSLNFESEKCGIQSSTPDMILGNRTTAKQYPWLVLLEYANGSILCGGSLISRRHVLTAGHCVETLNGPPTFTRLSEYNTTTYPMDIALTESGFNYIKNIKIPIKWSKRHPEFNWNTYQNDIGLVKMAHNAHYSDYIRPICLPRNDFLEQINAGTQLVTAGWGSNDVNHRDVKKDALLPYVPMKTCRRSLSTMTLTNKQICAGGGPSEQTCVGEFGGPLMFQNDDYYIAVGVLSYRFGQCRVVNLPGVYTNVYEYLEWINSMME